MNRICQEQLTAQVINAIHENNPDEIERLIVIEGWDPSLKPFKFLHISILVEVIEYMFNDDDDNNKKAFDVFKMLIHIGCEGDYHPMRLKALSAAIRKENMNVIKFLLNINYQIPPPRNIYQTSGHVYDCSPFTEAINMGIN